MPPAPQLLFDVNILLDVLLDRKPWAEPATELLSLCERKVVRGCWCAASVGTVYFLAKRELGPRRARGVVDDLMHILRVLPVDESIIIEAVHGDWPDLEDAIVHACARKAGVTYLVTRNPKDYRKASLEICDPDSLLSALVPPKGRHP